MSSLLNKARDKVEAVLDRNSNQGNEARSDNYGAHSSNATNQVDSTVRSDLDHRNNPQGRVNDFGGTQSSHQFGTGPAAGAFASSDNYGSSTNASGYDNPRSTHAGLHSNNITNQFDPRVDSDRDHRNNPTSHAGGLGNTQQHHENYNSSGRVGGFGETGAGYGSTSAAYDQTSTMTEPHRSNLANQMDPRYDGDMDNRHNLGSTTSGHSHGHHNPAGTGVHDATTMGHGSTFDHTHSTNTGPHNNSMLNKLDPRHDNVRDQRNDPSSRMGGYGSTQTEDYGHTTGIGRYDNTRTGEYDHSTGVSHSYPASGTTAGHGGHSGQQATGYGDSNATTGSGTANKTAGPHNSNLLNQLDPRVDSDMDGSKTYGGNKTHY